jgi:hypothetical protein
MAKGLGVKLGALVYASNQPTPVSYMNGFVGGRIESLDIMSAAPKNLRPLAISPARITKSATVYAVFSIE